MKYRINIDINNQSGSNVHWVHTNVEKDDLIKLIKNHLEHTFSYLGFVPTHWNIKVDVELNQERKVS